MMKNTPPSTPTYYADLCAATYETDTTGYLKENVSNTELIADATVRNNWRLCLIKNKVTQELTLAGRGTEILSGSNWISNLFAQMAYTFGYKSSRNKQEFNEMLQVKNMWERQYGKITSGTGHSAIARYLGRLLSEDVPVTTFNGHLADDGPNRINLARAQDLTAQGLSPSICRHYTIIDPEHMLTDAQLARIEEFGDGVCPIPALPHHYKIMAKHLIKEFKETLNDRDFCDLSDQFAPRQKEGGVYVALDQLASDQFDKLATRLEGNQAKLNQEFAPLLGNDGTLIDKLSIDEIEESIPANNSQVKEACTEVLNDANQCGSKAKEAKINTAQILGYVNQMIAKIGDLITGENKLQSERRQWVRSMQAKNEESGKLLNSSQTPITIPSAQPHPGIIPTNFCLSQQMELANKYLKKYASAQEKLSKLLEDRKKWLSQSNNQAARVWLSDGLIRDEYKELCQSAKKLSTSIQLVSLALLAVATAATAGGGSTFPAFLNCAVTTANVGGSILNKKPSKAASRFQEQMEQNSRTLNSIAHFSAGNKQEIHAIYAQQRQLVDNLLQSGRYMDPVEYRKNLGTAQEKLTNQKSDLEKDLKDDSPRSKNKKYLQLQIDNQKGIIQHYWDKQDYERCIEEQGKLATYEHEFTKLEKEEKNDKEALEATNNSLEDLEKEIRLEKGVAHLKDPSYQINRARADRWRGASDEEKKFRETIDDCYTDFERAREAERIMINGTLGAVDQFLAEVSNLNTSQPPGSASPESEEELKNLRKARTAVAVVQQAYSIFDQLETWSHLAGRLSDELEEMQKTNADATLNDVIKKLGVFHCVTKFVIPGIQIMAMGLSFYRILKHMSNDCPVMDSIEVQMLRNLETLLKDKSARLETLIKNTEENLIKENRALKERLSILYGKVSTEILNEIEHTRAEIMDKIEDGEYNRITTKAHRSARKLHKERERFLIANHSSKEIDHFLKEIDLLLKVDTTATDLGGVMKTRDGYHPIVETRLISQNPDVYTPLISLKVDSKPAPSLHLLQEVIDSISAAAPFLSREQLTTILNQLRPQAERIVELSDQLPRVCAAARNKQKKIISLLQKNMKKMPGRRNRYQKEKLESLLDEKGRKLLNNLSNPDSLIAANKYNYVQALLDPIHKKFTPRVDDMKSRAPGAVISGVALAGFGFIFGGPIGATMLGGYGFYAAASPHPYVPGDILFSRAKNGFGSKSIIELAKENRVKFDSYRGGWEKIEHSRAGTTYIEPPTAFKISAWINDSGILNMNSDWSFINSKKKGSINELKKSAFHINMHFNNFNLDCEWSLKHETPGAIKVEDLKKLDPRIHLPKDASYQKAIQELTSDYSKWMQSVAANESIPEKNLFYHYQKRATVIPSLDDDLVPIAFPTPLIDHMYQQLKLSLSTMEATDVSTLAPYYKVIYNEKKLRWDVIIGFRSVSNIESIEDKPYVEFPPVATLNQGAALAFAPPQYNQVKETVFPKPNINEMLIHSLYTDILKGNQIGMPGSDSVFFGDGQLLAPAEVPFPGFFRLWERAPQSAIHFNSKEYTVEMSEALFQFVGNKPHERNTDNKMVKPLGMPQYQEYFIDVELEIRKAKKKIKEQLGEFTESYHLLMAYSCLLSKLSKEELTQEFERELGIFSPQGFDSLIEFIGAGHRLNRLTDMSVARLEDKLSSHTNPTLVRFRDSLLDLESKLLQ